MDGILFKQCNDCGREKILPVEFPGSQMVSLYQCNVYSYKSCFQPVNKQVYIYTYIENCCGDLKVPVTQALFWCRDTPVSKRRGNAYPHEAHLLAGEVDDKETKYKLILSTTVLPTAPFCP